jgi:hypothetical protein
MEIEGVNKIEFNIFDKEEEGDEYGILVVLSKPKSENLMKILQKKANYVIFTHCAPDNIFDDFG